jgi:hypothetical protein
MYQVAILFTNGATMLFDAQEFDVDLSFRTLGGEEKYSSEYSSVHKVTYKDAQGDTSPIYLNPTEVAGISVVPVTDGSTFGRALVDGGIDED